MSAFTPDVLTAAGFAGFASVRALAAERCRSIPIAGGVYLVRAPDGFAPTFLATSTGGHFKGKDPTVAVDTLRERWPIDTNVIYIGKATLLQERVRALLDFGAGKAIGHWGGRYLWQVADSDSFLIGWRREADPINAEARLLQAYASEFGSLPFANLRW